MFWVCLWVKDGERGKWLQATDEKEALAPSVCAFPYAFSAPCTGYSVLFTINVHWEGLIL